MPDHGPIVPRSEFPDLAECGAVALRRWLLMFNYDWFHGTPFQQQQEDAKIRCTLSHFPKLDPEEASNDEQARKFFDEVDVRRLIYLRDGFSYEYRDFADVESKTHLVFECEPVDEQYKVGAFVVSVPFDEIVRVEVFAVHPSEKPEDSPQITGFRSRPERNPHDDGQHAESQPVMNETDPVG